MIIEVKIPNSIKPYAPYVCAYIGWRIGVKLSQS